MVALDTGTIHPTLAAIDAAVVGTADRDQDLVIRGSSIGQPCERHLWYRFRWAHEPETFGGRMLRLFDTGQVEEARMVAWLRLAGIEVADVDPDTGEQWEVSAADGHFKGHLDGILTGLLEAPRTPHLLECKTHNEASFRQLRKVGLAVAKPVHLAQMQIYMHLAGLTRGYYLAKNKNDDELYAERVHHDAAHAGQLMAKIERILAAARALPKISEDAGSFACRFCASHGVCHQAEFALRNCRTCLHSTPVSGGDARWWCERHDRELGLDDQRAGCALHLYIPDLVPAEQVDVAGDGSSVTYQLPDGRQWVDGRAA